MEVLTADGSNSSDALKEDKMVKVNGDINGSVDCMDVDEDSADGGDGGASDESVCGSSRAADGDEPNSRFGSDADADADAKSNSHFESEGEGEGKSNSHFESEGEGKVNYEESDGEGKTHSQFGSEYGARSEGQMDVDGLGEAEGDSLNSEDEDGVMLTDNENENENETEELQTTRDNGAGGQRRDEANDTDEEGDINEGVDDCFITRVPDSGDGAEKPEPSADLHTAKSDEGENKTIETPTEEQNGSAEPPNKKRKIIDLTVSPRRSSRTVQKPVRFGHETNTDEEDEEEDEEEDDDDDDIEEIPPTDPLANTILDKDNCRFPRIIGNTTIVVNDAKRLADIATARAQLSQPKKETTLVIIETEKGRVPAPITLPSHCSVTITQQPAPTKHYQIPAPVAKPRAPQILPTLTDDMYVVEAPSFIVPYVYEKPPVKKLRRYLRRMLKEVKKQEEEEEDESKKKPIEKKTDAESPADANKEDKEPKLLVESEKKEIGNDEDADKAEKEKEKEREKMEEETESDGESSDEEEKKKSTGASSYFDNPLGKFFMQIGLNLVQEFVQTDLLKMQKKKQKMGKGTEETQAAIISLKKNLLLSKESNEPYTMEQTKCEFCSFKTESKLIMAHHLETPHMRNYVYRCNFCPLEVRGPHDILYHMEAEHCVRGRLERAPAFHQCPQCPFEDNQKGKLTRHSLTCGKKFRPEKNLEPPPDWEPPAKIPRLPRKPTNMQMSTNSLYSHSLGKNIPAHILPKMPAGLPGATSPLLRPPRGRPAYPQLPPPAHKLMGSRTGLPPQLARGNLMYRSPNSTNSPVILPTSYQLPNNQIYQVVGPQGQVMSIPGGPPSLQRLAPPQQKNPATVKLLNQPSISITPLPRQSSTNPQPGIPPTRPGTTGSNSKNNFVICEICDGYIKDLEQLRNHMQWIHKVKIHPKMIYNRPPLNCQKCQFRFFTDQGLERHLLGTHGLVTSSMQDQANRGKDGGRCPVCGRVYQWKLLNHVSRDHNMTLKPAHLSYKCTVCTATFGMYKQFENHVYSAHSLVAKRVIDKKNGQTASTSRNDTAALLKPLKINDEITIIPQPAKKPSGSQQPRPVPGNFRVTPPKARGPDSVQVIDLEDSPNKSGENGSESLTAVKERLRRRQSLEIRQVESEPDETESEGETSAPVMVKSRPVEPDDDQGTDGDSEG